MGIFIAENRYFEKKMNLTKLLVTFWHAKLWYRMSCSYLDTSLNNVLLLVSSLQPYSTVLSPFMSNQPWNLTTTTLTLHESKVKYMHIVHIPPTQGGGALLCCHYKPGWWISTLYTPHTHTPTLRLYFRHHTVACIAAGRPHCLHPFTHPTAALAPR